MQGHLRGLQQPRCRRIDAPSTPARSSAARSLAPARTAMLSVTHAFALPELRMFSKDSGNKVWAAFAAEARTTRAVIWL